MGFGDELVERGGGDFDVVRSSDHANLAEILPHVELVVMVGNVVCSAEVALPSPASWEHLVQSQFQ